MVQAIYCRPNRNRTKSQQSRYKKSQKQTKNKKMELKQQAELKMTKVTYRPQTFKYQIKLKQ